MPEHVVALAAAQAKAEAAVVQALEADLNQAVINQALVKKVVALKVVALKVVVALVKDQVVVAQRKEGNIKADLHLKLQHQLKKSIIKFSKGLNREKLKVSLD